MDGRAGRATLEDILTEVENDETLASGEVQGGRRETSGKEEAEEGGAQGLGGLGLPLVRPELLSRLPMLLRAVRSLTEPPRGPDKPPHSPEALLCALRPYLNEQRRRAVDTMIRMARLSESLGSQRE